MVYFPGFSLVVICKKSLAFLLQYNTMPHKLLQIIRLFTWKWTTCDYSQDSWSQQIQFKSFVKDFTSLHELLLTWSYVYTIIQPISYAALDNFFFLEQEDKLLFIPHLLYNNRRWWHCTNSQGVIHAHQMHLINQLCWAINVWQHCCRCCKSITDYYCQPRVGLYWSQGSIL